MITFELRNSSDKPIVVKTMIPEAAEPIEQELPPGQSLVIFVTPGLRVEIS